MVQSAAQQLHSSTIHGWQPTSLPSPQTPPTTASVPADLHDLQQTLHHYHAQCKDNDVQKIQRDTNEYDSASW